MTLSEKAKTFLGATSGSRKHKELIDYYNQYIRPLPRGYRVKYTDSWCMVFVSDIQSMVGVQNPVYECSCRVAYKEGVSKKQGIPVNKGGIDDIIFYDWGNDGSINHTGIIIDVLPDKFRVIEGNMGGKVGIRTIAKNSSVIEGIIRVKQTNPIETNKELNEKDLMKIARDVIKGKYGNGNTRKILLGENYLEVQKIVNELTRKK